MSRGRRATLLLALAVLLGALAAGDIAAREAALRRAVGSPVPVVVAARALAEGQVVGARALAVRRVPARYAPRDAYASPRALAGARLAVAVPAGADITPAMVDDGAAGGDVALRPGERVADVIARGDADLVVPGGRVDVLVTRERGDGSGETRLALEDVEVVSVRRAAGDELAGAAGSHLAAGLRVSLRQAVYLAAAQSFARELRILPRAVGDRGRGAQSLEVPSELE